MTKAGVATRERGSTTLIILLVLVIIAAGAIGYWTWKHNNDNDKKSKTPPSVASCTNLALSQGSASGAAGTIYKNAVVTNNGSKTCKITGYPGVFLLNGGGTQLGSGAAANSLYPATAVTLAPGAKAHTVVAFPQQGNFEPGACTAKATTMRLYVPGVSTALTTPWADYNCPGFSATAFKAGAS